MWNRKTDSLIQNFSCDLLVTQLYSLLKRNDSITMNITPNILKLACWNELVIIINPIML